MSGGRCSNRAADASTANLKTLDETLVRTSRGERVTASQALRQPEIRLETLLTGEIGLDLDPHSRDLDVASVETAVKYAGYLKQEAARAARIRRDERRQIPESFPFAKVPGLSREVVQRLSQVRPETLGQASRVPGVTPAAVAVLGAFLGRLAPEIPASS
jgi:tRNA uridine 5-carboxymethylaminomethyl modification enzyme